jgi:hypothetical protein
VQLTHLRTFQHALALADSLLCILLGRQVVLLRRGLPCFLQAVFPAVVALGPGCRGCPRCHPPQGAGDLVIALCLPAGTSLQGCGVPVKYLHQRLAVPPQVCLADS